MGRGPIPWPGSSVRSHRSCTQLFLFPWESLFWSRAFLCISDWPVDEAGLELIEIVCLCLPKGEIKGMCPISTPWKIIVILCLYCSVFEWGSSVVITFNHMDIFHSCTKIWGSVKWNRLELCKWLEYLSFPVAIVVFQILKPYVLMCFFFPILAVSFHHVFLRHSWLTS